jgi:hypothetical protein
MDWKIEEGHADGSGQEEKNDPGAVLSSTQKQIEPVGSKALQRQKNFNEVEQEEVIWCKIKIFILICYMIFWIIRCYKLVKR